MGQLTNTFERDIICISREEKLGNKSKLLGVLQHFLCIGGLVWGGFINRRHNIHYKPLHKIGVLESSFSFKRKILALIAAIAGKYFWTKVLACALLVKNEWGIGNEFQISRP